MLEARAPRPGDAALYAALFGDPRVGGTLWPGDLGGPRTPAQAAALVAHDVERWDREGFGPWVLFAGDDFVARGGLERTTVGGRPRVEVLYAVVPGAWGNGYATEIARRAVADARERGLPEGRRLRVDREPGVDPRAREGRPAPRAHDRARRPPPLARPARTQRAWPLRFAPNLKSLAP